MDISIKNLSNVIKEIKKELTKEELNGNELIEGVVCPHIFELGITTLNNNDKLLLYSEIKRNVINKYSLPYELNGYFCKICGAQLAESDKEGIVKFLGSEKIREGINEDRLQNMIWKETIYIISTYIKFNNPLPIKPLVNSISSILRDIISNIETKIIKNRTSTVDSIKDTLNLYTCIYVYASLCVIMLNNPKKMIFGRDKPEKKLLGSSEKFEEERKSERLKRKSRKKYKGGGDKNINNTKLYEKHLLTTSLNLIIVTKDSIIKRLKNINIDIIKQIFLKEAYTWAKSFIKPISVKNNKTNYSEIIMDIINYDPFYKYIYFAKSLSYFTGNNKLKNVEFNDTKQILGRTLDELEEDITKKISIYNNIDDVPEWKIKDEIYDHYTWRSFIQEYKYVKQKIYEKSFEPLHIQVLNYFEEFKDIKEYERKIYTRIQKNNIRSLITFKWLYDIRGDYDDFRPEKIDLSRYYCSNGEKHKIDKYIYSIKIGQKNEEYTKEEIIKWLENKDIDKLAKFSLMKLINERCGKCKKLVRTNTIDIVNNGKIESIFKDKDNINAFYDYYKYRCPKGNLHEFVGDKCKQCGINININININDKYNNEYYNKYSNIFKKVEIENQKIIINNLKLAQTELKVIETKKEPLDYKFSLNKTAEWSKITNIKYNILVNIGLADEKKFDDIENARVDMTKNILEEYDYILMTKSMRLKNYINSIIRKYNFVMNYKNIIEIPEKLNLIITEQKKVGIDNMEKELPQFKDEFSKLDKKYSSNLSLKNYANFLQEYIANIFIKITNDSSVKYKKMASNLVKYFSNEIIEQEKIYSKEESLFSKTRTDITTMEEANDLNLAISGDEYLGYSTEKSIDEFSVEDNRSDGDNIINNIEEIYDDEILDEMDE